MTKSFRFYFFIFAATYIVASIIVAIIGAYLSSSMSGVSVFVPFAVASFVGSLFLKHEQRMPLDAERKRLTNGSFLIFLAFNVIIFGIVITLGGLGDISSLGSQTTLIMIMLCVFAFIFLITYLMIRWAYGSQLTKQANKMGLTDTQN